MPEFLWCPGGEQFARRRLCGCLILAHAAGTAELLRGKRCFAFPHYCRGSPENCSPPGAAGRMALPSFSMRGLGCADILPLAQKCGGEKISCLSHTAIRGRQRIASTAGVARELLPPQVGARELIPPQVVLSTKSLGGCIIMLSAAGDSRLLIPNKGVSRHEVFHLPCCI